MWSSSCFTALNPKSPSIQNDENEIKPPPSVSNPPHHATVHSSPSAESQDSVFKQTSAPPCRVRWPVTSLLHIPSYWMKPHVQHIHVMRGAFKEAAAQRGCCPARDTHKGLLVNPGYSIRLDNHIYTDLPVVTYLNWSFCVSLWPAK